MTKENLISFPTNRGVDVLRYQSICRDCPCDAQQGVCETKDIESSPSLFGPIGKSLKGLTLGRFVFGPILIVREMVDSQVSQTNSEEVADRAATGSVAEEFPIQLHSWKYSWRIIKPF